MENKFEISLTRHQLVQLSALAWFRADRNPRAADGQVDFANADTAAAIAMAMEAQAALQRADSKSVDKTAPEGDKDHGVGF